MNLKLSVFGLVILVLVGISVLLDRGQPLDHRYLRDSARLLPASSGPYRLSSTSRSEFGQLLGDPVVEQGAVYSKGPQGDRIELELMLNQVGTHNAIGCYLARGEKLLWQRMLNLQTKKERATLAVAALSDAGQIHLVASTQCWNDGCEERPASAQGLSVQAFLFHNFFAAQSRPVSVVLLRNALERDLRGDAMDTGGVSTVREFMADFDLSSIRRAAASRAVGL